MARKRRLAAAGFAHHAQRFRLRHRRSVTPSTAFRVFGGCQNLLSFFDIKMYFQIGDFEENFTLFNHSILPVPPPVLKQARKREDWGTSSGGALSHEDNAAGMDTL